MQCQHCSTEIKYIEEDGVTFYINSRASRYRYYEDDLFCLWPKEDIMHIPLPIDKIDEVIYRGRSGADPNSC